MSWAEPLHSKNQYDKAGQCLAKYDPLDRDIFRYIESIDIINNWRASHQYPLNTFQMTLRRKSRQISSAALVSQRLKRLESIDRKLKSGSMELTQMQDIGGCRSVLPSVSDVRSIRELYMKSEFLHSLKNEKDYIMQPKPDGYRSLHLIYRYKGEGRTEIYNGLQIEIQLRTQMQHAWATAVEAVSVFTKQALKWKGGTPEWQEFFRLVSKGIAIIENCDPASEMGSVSKRLRDISKKLPVNHLFEAYRLTLNYIGSMEQRKARMMLVHMRPDIHKVEVFGYRLAESQRANEHYAQIEKSISSSDVSQAVLVRVDSVDSLRKAYPNFFLDTELFSKVVDTILKWRAFRGLPPFN